MRETRVKIVFTRFSIGDNMNNTYSKRRGLINRRWERREDFFL